MVMVSLTLGNVSRNVLALMLSLNTKTFKIILWMQK